MRTRTPRTSGSDRAWTLVAPGYDRAVALVGWHRAQDALVADVRSGSVLEVGCGPAHMAVALRARGVAYVGLDRSAAMLARARRIAPVVRGDVGALPFADSAFDVVVASGVLGLLTVAQRGQALRELARVGRGDVRLLEPVHRPGTPVRPLRSRFVALVRERPIELEELRAAGLEPTVLGPAVLGGVYVMVRSGGRSAV